MFPKNSIFNPVKTLFDKVEIIKIDDRILPQKADCQIVVEVDGSGPYFQ